MNTEILRAMVRPAIIQGRLDRLEKAFREAGPTIIDKDPALIATYLLNCHGDDSFYTPAMLIRTARALEGDVDPRHSLRIYQLVWDHHPQSPEIEMVLYRMAFCWWERLQEAEKSRAALTELLKRYPYGSMEPHAKALLRRIGS